MELLLFLHFPKKQLIKLNNQIWKELLLEEIKNPEFEKYEWIHIFESVIKNSSNSEMESNIRSEVFWHYFVLEKDDNRMSKINSTSDQGNNQEQIQSGIFISLKLFKIFEKINIQIYNNDAHPLKIILNNFHQWFQQKFLDYISLNCVNIKEDKKEVYKKIKNNIDSFCLMLGKAILLFYGMTIGEYNHSEIDLVLMFTYRLILTNETYLIVYNIISSYLSDSIEIFTKVINKLEKCIPSDISISNYFAMNPLFREKFSKNNSSNNSTNILEDHLINKESINLDKLTSFESSNSYEESIKILNEIRNIECPELKIIHLEKLIKKIAEEIDKFWEGYDIPKKDLTVDPDNLLSIIIYITIKSKNSKLLSEVEYMDSFITNTSKISGKGYNLSVLSVACKYLLEDKLNTILKNSA